MRTTFAILAAGAATALLVASCFDAKSFDCGTDDTRCVSGERCIGGHCAEPNATCASGFAYTRSFAAAAHQCVTNLPDGGLKCSRAGEICDDADPCTESDVCIDTMTCKGTPKVCPGATCSGNSLASSKCVAGTCMTTMSTCPTGFLCGSSTACANTCTSADQCVPGSYCVSGKCLLCTDFLSSASFIPVYGKPTVIPGSGVNTVPSVTDGGASGGTERSPVMSGDRLTLYYASDRNGGNGGLDLYRATRSAADLSTPFGSSERLVPLNSVAGDIDLSTGDDNLFAFATDRGGNFDIWQTTLGSGVFSTPGPVPGDLAKPINTTAREAHPWLSSDGTRLYFDTDRDTAMTMVEKYFRVYLASRASTQVAFGPAAVVAGLDSTNPTWSPQWTSPVVTRDGSAMFLINQAVPTKPEVAVVHLDKATGQPVSVPTTLHGLDLAQGGQLSISADGCTLLMQRRENGEADLWWSQRQNVTFCNSGVPCGANDGCCPAQCTGVVDQDCPFPRTQLVSEYLSQTDTNHDYRLTGEAVGGSYAATGVTFRVFIDALPTTVALNRFVSITTCSDARLYTYIGTDSPGSPPSGTRFDRQLGFVFPLSAGNANGVSRIFRSDAIGCDGPLTFDQTCSGQVGTCRPLGFVVKP